MNADEHMQPKACVCHRDVPITPADKVVAVAWRRNVDDECYAVGDASIDGLEIVIANDLGLSWSRVARALDRLHIIRSYRGLQEP